MATVTFPNGKTVTFQGNPTPADIDHAAQTMGIKPNVPQLQTPVPTPDGIGPMKSLTQNNSTGTTPTTSTDTSAKDFVGGLLKSGETPIASVGATPVQFLAKLLGRPDPYAGGVPGGIPGSGDTLPIAPVTPAGLVQKAGQTGEIATNAFVPAEGGLLKLGALGGANALSQALAGGDTNKDSLLSHTIFGTLTGLIPGVGGDLAKFAGEAEKIKTGVYGKTYSTIAQTDPELLNHYINTTLAHNESDLVPTPDALASDAFKKYSNIFLSRVMPEAGAALGAIKKTVRDVPLAIANDAGQVVASGKEAAQNLFGDIRQKVEDMTGHTFGTIEKSGFDGGRVPILSRVPGVNINLTSAEEKLLTSVQSHLDGLLNYKPTVGAATDAIINLRNELGTALKSSVVGDNSPVEGAVKYAIGAINNATKNASPELSAALDKYHALADIRDEISKQAGKDLQNSSTVERRVLSGDQAEKVLPLLQNLSKEVMPYIKQSEKLADPLLRGNLVQHARLADWSKMMFGDQTTKTLMRQNFNKEINGATSVFSYPSQYLRYLSRGALGVLAPDAAKYAMSVAKGAPQSMEPVARTIDSWVSSSEGKNIVSGFAKGLAKMGITAKNIERAALPLAKTYFINKLNNPETGLGAQMSNPDTGYGRVPADLPPTPQRTLTGN